MANTTSDSSVKEHLLSESDWSDALEEESHWPDQKRSRTLLWSLAFNVVLVLVLAFVCILTYWPRGNSYHIPGEIYSPAGEAVRYKTVVFHSGFPGDNDTTEYQGSGTEVDGRWEDLYNAFGVSLISQDAARQLPNATTPLPQDRSVYVVQLDVFHQIHCLNRLRKLLYPQVYHTDISSGSEESADALNHLEHCVESLRQSLQCSSDISTIYWQWSPKFQHMLGNPATTHTCRDFEHIREWAVQHKLDDDFDLTVKVEGAPIRKAG